MPPNRTQNNICSTQTTCPRPTYQSGKNKLKQKGGRTITKPSKQKEVPQPRLADLENLDELVKNKFRIAFDLKPFQREAVRAQLLQRDSLVHAHTGAGKSLIIAAPHAHPLAEGKVTFVVSPLIALQDEHAEAFREEYGLSTIAINSAHGGLTAQNMTEICSGKYQVVLISPEMMLTKRFIEKVLRNVDLRKRILSVVVDEAHVISHWGGAFRKKYGELGILRALLPKGVPFTALSATLSPRVRNDVISKLHFSTGSNGFINIDIGNDRPNVSLVVRAMEHPMNTYRDLDFVIPSRITPDSPIPKTFIYADNIATGADIQDHLESLLPEHLRNKNLIRPYSAAYSKKYRKAVMNDFKSDNGVRVLICTDAAGMGCNIPDIDVVVQWKMPDTASIWVQRAGRAARGNGRVGLAVLLVEKSAYGLDCERLEEKARKGEGKSKKGSKESTETTGDYSKGTGKKVAERQGVKRGSQSGLSDTLPQRGWEPTLVPRAKDENLLAFVLTGKCRREILTSVYKNQALSPSRRSCCDVCDPTLLDRCRPGKYTSPPRQSGVEKGELDKGTQLAIHKWRINTYERHHSGSQWSFKGILSDSHLELLASTGPIPSIERLKTVLGHWSWWDKHGVDLWNYISKLTIPPFKKKVKEGAKAAAGTKRKEPERVEGEVLAGSSEKRARTTSTTTSNQNIQPPRTPAVTLDTRPDTANSSSHHHHHLPTTPLSSLSYLGTPIPSTRPAITHTPRDPFSLLTAYPTPNTAQRHSTRYETPRSTTATLFPQFDSPTTPSPSPRPGSVSSYPQQPIQNPVQYMFSPAQYDFTVSLNRSIAPSQRHDQYTRLQPPSVTAYSSPISNIQTLSRNSASPAPSTGLANAYGVHRTPDYLCHSSIPQVYSTARETTYPMQTFGQYTPHPYNQYYSTTYTTRDNHTGSFTQYEQHGNAGHGLPSR